MTKYAQANAIQVRYSKMTAGTPPTSANGHLLNLRCNAPNITPTINTTTSQELRSDRATADLIRTSASSGGDISFEVSFKEYEPFIAAALGGTWTADTTTSGINMTTTLTNTLTAASGAPFANVIAGDFVTLTGFAAAKNNNTFRVRTVTSSTVLILDGVLANEAGVAATVAYDSSFTIVTGTTDCDIDYTAAVGAAAATATLTLTAGTWPATILRGMWLCIRDATTPTGIIDVPMRVLSITGSSKILTVETPGGVLVDIADQTLTIRGSNVRNGITSQVFFFEEEYGGMDTATFITYQDQLINTFNLNASSGAIFTGSMGVMGTNVTTGATTTSASDETLPVAFNVLNGVSNLKNIVFRDYTTGDILSGIKIKSLNMSTTNNARNLDAVGSLYPFATNQGSIGITIAGEAYFNDTTLLANYVAGTEMKLSYIFSDTDDLTGNLIIIDVPRVKLSAGSLSGKQLNSDVVNSVTFTSVHDSTDGFMAQVSSIPA